MILASMGRRADGQNIIINMVDHKLYSHKKHQDKVNDSEHNTRAYKEVLEKCNF